MELKTFFFHLILLYKHYIDDIFVLFQGDLGSLNSFHQYLNSITDHRKFTMSFSEETLDFLDAHSCHPPSLNKGLRVSQLHRIKHICSTDLSLETRKREMWEKFKEKGYRDSWLDCAGDKLKTIQREQLLASANTTRNIKRNASVKFITTYTPQVSAFRNIIKKYWYVLQSDPDLSKTFEHSPIMSFRRAKNLKNSLVKADVCKGPLKPPPFAIPPGNYKCGNCTQCQFTRRLKCFPHPRTGKNICIKSVITCNSCNVIYAIRCPCGMLYVGETSRELKTHICEHSAIRCRDESNPVAQHFKRYSHSICELFYFGFEQIHSAGQGGHIDVKLKSRETFYFGFAFLL